MSSFCIKCESLSLLGCPYAHSIRSDLFTYTTNMGTSCSIIHKLFKYENDSDFAYCLCGKVIHQIMCKSQFWGTYQILYTNGSVIL